MKNNLLKQQTIVIEIDLTAQIVDHLIRDGVENVWGGPIRISVSPDGVWTARTTPSVLGGAASHAVGNGMWCGTGEAFEINEHDDSLIDERALYVYLDAAREELERMHVTTLPEAVRFEHWDSDAPTVKPKKAATPMTDESMERLAGRLFEIHGRDLIDALEEVSSEVESERDDLQNALEELVLICNRVDSLGIDEVLGTTDIDHAIEETKKNIVSRLEQLNAKLGGE